mmetsp:Transcript_16678/g.56884  ORF Transcript_16678/g.56884 Transcript_16678/m.56884 type:complete len:268 (+) Transcript_16678:259-1062(+)
MEPARRPRRRRGVDGDGLIGGEPERAEGAAGAAAPAHHRRLAWHQDAGRHATQLRAAPRRRPGAALLPVPDLRCGGPAAVCGRAARGVHGRRRDGRAGATGRRIQVVRALGLAGTHLPGRLHLCGLRGEHKPGPELVRQLCVVVSAHLPGRDTKRVARLAVPHGGWRRGLPGVHLLHPARPHRRLLHHPAARRRHLRQVQPGGRVCPPAEAARARARGRRRGGHAAGGARGPSGLANGLCCEDGVLRTVGHPCQLGAAVDALLEARH